MEVVLLAILLLLIAVIQIVGLVVIYKLVTRNVGKQFQNQREFLQDSLRVLTDSQVSIHAVEGEDMSRSTESERDPTDIDSKNCRSFCEPYKKQTYQHLEKDKDLKYYEEDFLYNSSDDYDNLGWLAEEADRIDEESLDEIDTFFENNEHSVSSITNEDKKPELEAALDSEDDSLMPITDRDRIGGKKRRKNIKNVVLNTKTIESIYFDGPITAVMIGDNNTQKNFNSLPREKPQPGNNLTRSLRTHHKRKDKRRRPNMKRQHQIKDPRNNRAEKKQFAHTKEKLPDTNVIGDNRAIDEENVAAIKYSQCASPSWETLRKDNRSGGDNAKVKTYAETNIEDDSRISAMSRGTDEFSFKGVNQNAIKSKAGAIDSVIKADLNIEKNIHCRRNKNIDDIDSVYASYGRSNDPNSNPCICEGCRILEAAGRALGI